jgi:hypothetical protein
MVLVVLLLAHAGPIGCGMYCRKRSRCRKGGQRYVWTWRMLYGDYGRWMKMGGSLRGCVGSGNDRPTRKLLE